MVVGYLPLKQFLRRSAGVDIDKSDTDRLTDLIGKKLNDLLVIGVRNASYNNRDIIMEPDLPSTKGYLERPDNFRPREAYATMRQQGLAWHRRASGYAQVLHPPVVHFSAAAASGEMYQSTIW